MGDPASPGEPPDPEPVDAKEPEPAGPVLAQFFADLVKDQDARKASIESRGLAVITTSGTVVTLLFGLVAVITKVDGFTLPYPARGPIGFAVFLLVFASVLAVLTNIPTPGYKNVTAAELRKVINKHWDKSKADADVRVASTRVGMFESAAKINGIKAWILVAAMACEVIGLVGVALAVREVIVAL